jgi:hypothetical protein
MHSTLLYNAIFDPIYKYLRVVTVVKYIVSHGGGFFTCTSLQSSVQLA